MQLAMIWGLSLSSIAQAIPNPQGNSSSSLDSGVIGNGTYVLPIFDHSPAKRAAEIFGNRAGYLYGPSLVGNSSFFLTGPLGDKLVQREVALWYKDATPVNEAVEAEANLVLTTLSIVSRCHQ